MGINLANIERQTKVKSNPGDEKRSAGISFNGKILKDAKKEEFYSGIYLLLQSGIDLKGSIEIFISQQQATNIQNIFSRIEQMLIMGNSFSEAMQQFPDFSAYEYYSIKIGEESGQLKEVLFELGLYYQRKIKQQKQLVSAFSYPSVILLTAIAAVGFMMNFIVPLFADAFKRFNTDLPALTLIIVKISSDIRDYWWLFILLMLGICFGMYSLQKIIKVREWLMEKIKYLPVIGILLQKIYLARFCQSMALMTAAGTPLIISLDLVEKMSVYLPLKKALVAVRQEIFMGKTLHEAMSIQSIFDRRMISLIKVGEETNRLDVIFKRLYDQLSGDADHQTSIMNAMLEPLLIVLVGGLVAVILVAMYLPMFKIGNAMM